jgi:hypothetical protein
MALLKKVFKFFCITQYFTVYCFLSSSTLLNINAVDSVLNQSSYRDGLGVYRVFADFMSRFQGLISGIIPIQKCHMGMGHILKLQNYEYLKFRMI